MIDAAAKHWMLGVLLICSSGYAQNASDPSARGEVHIGESLREATLEGLNGPNRALSEFRGRPLVINVWASWCGPCRQEMKSLDRLAWRADRPDFSIIGISTDDDAEAARRLLRETHVTISEFLDTALRMEHMLGASKLPLTVFVGPDGRVLEKIYGAREWDAPEALQLIESAFAKGSRAAH